MSTASRHTQTNVDPLASSADPVMQCILGVSENPEGLSSTAPDRTCAQPNVMP